MLTDARNSIYAILTYVYIYIFFHPQKDYFVVSRLFSVIRHIYIYIFHRFGST